MRFNRFQAKGFKIGPMWNSGDIIWKIARGIQSAANAATKWPQSVPERENMTQKSTTDKTEDGSSFHSSFRSFVHPKYLYFHPITAVVGFYLLDLPLLSKHMIYSVRSMSLLFYLFCMKSGPCMELFSIWFRWDAFLSITWYYHYSIHPLYCR